MNQSREFNCIKIENINLWSHVGVLEEERELGQAFLLDIILWTDMNTAINQDKLSQEIDYCNAVKYVQQLALDIRCMTLEYFSEQILNCLEKLYGDIAIQITLTKCSPPIPGFAGSISINRSRNLD